MDHLCIRLLGGLEIQRGGASLPPFPTQKSEKVFAYLVLNRDRPIHRDILCGQFWGEHSAADARKALRTELWRIRSVLEPTGSLRGSCLRVESNLIGLSNPASWSIDVVDFEAAVRGSGADGHTLPSEREVDRLERAVNLYRGDFLEGHYDDWCLRHQDRYRMLRMTALERLVALHRDDCRWLDAIHWGRQLLREDPLREHIHRAVMASHLAMGDRPSALRQYESCARSLGEELAIEPMDETRRLYEAIRDGYDAAGSPDARDRDRGPRPSPRAGLAEEVESALRDLYALTERLERTRKALTAADRAHASS